MLSATAVDSSRQARSEVLTWLQLSETLGPLACELGMSPKMMGAWVSGESPTPNCAPPPNERRRLECELEWLRVECDLLEKVRSEMCQGINQRLAAIWNSPRQEPV